jgi:DNA invertase Pin-like site-specific DNA recombinase
MLVGYARVSTGEQKLDLQCDALSKVGCEQMFTDEMSGAKAERLGLTQALRFILAGDTLVVGRLDRLGRSLTDLTARMAELRLAFGAQAATQQNRRVGGLTPDDSRASSA